MESYQYVLLALVCLIIIFVVAVVLVNKVPAKESFDNTLQSDVLFDAQNQDDADAMSLGDRIVSFFNEIWNPKRTTLEVPELVKMDNVLTPSQVSAVDISAANLKPGQCIDLYKLTGAYELKVTGRFKDGDFYDAKYCLDKENDYNIDVCSIGRFVFAKGRNCWVFQGNLEDLSKIDSSDPKNKWELRKFTDMGLTDKELLDSCPFPKQYCHSLRTYFNNGHIGYRTFADGSKFKYDGKFITQIA